MHQTIYDLLDQAERAERLARTGMDPLTLERLREFATECRNQIATVPAEDARRKADSVV